MSRKLNYVILICLLFYIMAWLFYEENYTEPASADPAPVVSAEGAILVDAADGQVIYEKDADKKLYPASTTKIVTCLCALEIMEEVGAGLDSKLEIPSESVGIEGSSLYLKEGERVTLEELLYGALLRSGNDAATALAIVLGGDEEAFLKRMNDKAKSLGCINTNFSNPTGLFEEDHYTTARDMAAISRQAMKNPCFRKIVGSESWSSNNTVRKFSNKNKTLLHYEGATGIKTGYTKRSGRTLAASAKRSDVELIAVVLNAPDWFEDAYALMDYGFEREGVKK